MQDVSDDESSEGSEEDGDEDSDVAKAGGVKGALHLGRFCAARTRVYHQFSHWEVRLIVHETTSM